MNATMKTHQLPLLPDTLTDGNSQSRASLGSRTQVRSNGRANKIDRTDNPAHEWYRFVLSFPPHLVRQYLERFETNGSHLVLDPFCGTGTTLVECKKLGIPSMGIEAHPMAHFAASTKTDWSPEPEELLAHATDVAEYTTTLLASQGLIDIPFSSQKANCETPLRTLPEEEHRLLLRDSISPLPLHKTLLLLDAMSNIGSPSFRSHERLALARALVTTIGNLHFGPEVGVGKVKSDAPVVSPWLHIVRAIAADLASLRSLDSTPATVVHGDSRSISEFVPPSSVDAVFTSPPYPNEKDYTRTTRLESVLLGLVSTKHDLRALKRTLVRSNTRSVYTDDADHESISHIPEISRLAERIERRRKSLGKTSGFERMYHKVTLQYFGGMARHLEALRGCLRPGAMLGYVVGDQASYLRVMIRTGQLLGKIAQSLGYEQIDIDLFRTRRATATRDELREEVLVLRWPG